MISHPWPECPSDTPEKCRLRLPEVEYEPPGKYVGVYDREGKVLDMVITGQYKSQTLNCSVCSKKWRYRIPVTEKLKAEDWVKDK